jgi:hypothetical protein
LLEDRIPGVATQSIKDADTFFGVELPALTEWTFGPEQAAAIRRPVLSVIGAETRPLWVEIAEFLRASLPHVEECAIDGAGHLLHIQRSEPVARAIAEFWGDTPRPATGFARSDRRGAHAGHPEGALAFGYPSTPLWTPSLSLSRVTKRFRRSCRRRLLTDDQQKRRSAEPVASDA